MIQDILNKGEKHCSSNFILRCWHFIKIVNPIRTVYFNLVNFPLSTALKFPVLVGYHVQFMGLRRGCVRLKKDVNVHFGMVEMGIMRFPMISRKTLHTLIRIHSKSYIEFGDNIRIYSGASLIASMGGTILIGNDFLINQNSRIYACNQMTIGDHCNLGWEVQVMDSDFHFVINTSKKNIEADNKPISIGRNCWIASRTTVMKGSVIPPYSIVCGNSLFNKDFSHMTTKGNLFAGTPATIKATGLYRIFDEKKESLIRQHYKEDKSSTIFIPDDFDYQTLID